MTTDIFESLDALPAHYQRLFEEAGSRCVFLSLAWFQHFAETILGEHERSRIYGVSDDNLRETATVALVTRFRRLPAAVGRIRPLHLTGMSNYYTPVFGPVVAGTGAEVRRALQRAVAAMCSDVPRWDAVNLRPLDADSWIFSELGDALKSAGMIIQTYPCFQNWYLKVEGQSFQDYFESRPSVVKNTIRRKSKKIEKTGRARIEIVTSEENLEASIAAYESAYRASWKIPEPYPHFIHGLIRRCARAGWLRLGVAYIDGEPAAAQLWIVAGEIASIYKLAYDERFAEFSIGSILTARMMEYVIDVDKVREIDYLTGNDAYKRDWMSHCRERRGIMAFNPRTVYGVLGSIRHVGGRALKATLAELGVRTGRRVAVARREIHDDRGEESS